MAGTTLETDGKPFVDEDGDFTPKTANWLDVVGSHMIELLQAAVAGQLVLTVDPSTGIADCDLTYFGLEPDAAQTGPGAMSDEYVVADPEIDDDIMTVGGSCPECGTMLLSSAFLPADSSAGIGDTPVAFFVRPVGGGSVVLAEPLTPEELCRRAAVLDKLQEQGFDAAPDELQSMVRDWESAKMAEIRAFVAAHKDAATVASAADDHAPMFVEASDGEAELVEQINARFGPHDSLAAERSAAGFTSGPIWVGGLGEYEGPGIYWAESDRGITHEMLMNACEGLSDAERRAAHVRAGEVATSIGGQPTVRDLIDALAEIRERKLDGADEYSVVDVVDRLERAPTTRDIVAVELDRLQELGQEFDAAAREFGDLGWMSPIIEAAKDLSLEELKRLVDVLEKGQGGFLVADETHTRQSSGPVPARPATAAEIAAYTASCDPGCTHAPVHTESTGWTIGWQDSFGRECPEGPHAAPFAKPVPQDAPNAAPLPQPADASATGSPASPAASGGDLETACGADLDKIAAEKFDVKRTAGETDSSLRAFLRAKDLSGCRWVNPVATATDPAADREALARVAPALHWRGIAGSQSVEAGGRSHAVDGSEAVND